MSIPPETEQLKKKLAVASTSIAQSRTALRGPIPDRLFHYTTSAGMRGIFDSNRLWATNYRFLNDKNEVTYGFTILEQAIKDRLHAADDPIIIEVLSRILRTANAFDGMLDCYVACFCEHNDLLNQWRVYASAGGGYALGFHTHEIGLRWGRLHPNQDLVLTKVIYEPTDQIALVEQVIDTAVAELKSLLTAKSNVESANFLIALCCQFVRSHVADYLLSFKHKAFDVESEWRLCLTPSTDDEVKIQFRDGPYGLTPYVEIDLTPMAGINKDKLPLASITHGPVPDPSNTQFALAKLLRSKGYFHALIDGCDLPFRIGP